MAGQFNALSDGMQRLGNKMSDSLNDYLVKYGKDYWLEEFGEEYTGSDDTLNDDLRERGIRLMEIHESKRDGYIVKYIFLKEVKVHYLKLQIHDSYGLDEITQEEYSQERVSSDKMDIVEDGEGGYKDLNAEEG